MKTGKALGAGIALLALAALISGCVEFVGDPKAKQVGKKPKVDVTFKVCSAGKENTKCTTGGVGPARLLVAFRVPKGTKAPKRFVPRRGNGEGEIELVRNPSYSASLNEKAPRGKQLRWIGYSSDEVTNEELDLADTATFKVRLGVPKRLVGKRFRVTPIVGVAQISVEQPIDAPVVCADNPFDGTGVGAVGTWMNCIADPQSKADLKPVTVKVKAKKAKKRKR